MTYLLTPDFPQLNLDRIHSTEQFYNFAEDTASSFQLPENPTPEQIARMTPIILQGAIESVYDTSAYESGMVGSIIDPLDMSKVRMVRPGYHQGEFTADGKRDRYKFTMKDGGISFSPLS
jgi:hypothetical protein